MKAIQKKLPRNQRAFAIITNIEIHKRIFDTIESILGSQIHTRAKVIFVQYTVKKIFGYPPKKKKRY